MSINASKSCEALSLGQQSMKKRSRSRKQVKVMETQTRMVMRMTWTWRPQGADLRKLDKDSGVRVVKSSSSR